MGKGKSLLVVGCIITLGVFGAMCYLITTVNPDPLESEESGNDTDGDGKFYDESLDNVQPGLQKTIDPEHTLPNKSLPTNKTKNSPQKVKPLNLTTRSPRLNRTKNPPGRTIIISVTEYYSGPTVVKSITEYNSSITDITNLTNIEPSELTSTSPLLINVTETTAEYFNKTEEIITEDSSFTMKDTLSLVPVKRSIDNFKKSGGDLNSIILKIIDDSGQFNIEIKVDSNEIFRKKKTRRNSRKSKNKPKYKMSLKTSNNDQYERKLAKNTIISLSSNKSVIVNENNNDLKEENEVKNLSVQWDKNSTTEVNKNIIGTVSSNIAEVNNTPYYKITSSKTTATVIHKDVYTLPTITDTKTRYVNESDPFNFDKNYKLEKTTRQNYVRDENKTKYNSTTNNISFSGLPTMQITDSTLQNITANLNKYSTNIEITTVSIITLLNRTSTIKDRNLTITLLKNNNLIQTRKPYRSLNFTTIGKSLSEEIRDQITPIVFNKIQDLLYNIESDHSAPEAHERLTEI